MRSEAGATKNIGARRAFAKSKKNIFFTKNKKIVPKLAILGIQRNGKIVSQRFYIFSPIFFPTISFFPIPDGEDNLKISFFSRNFALI